MVGQRWLFGQKKCLSTFTGLNYSHSNTLSFVFESKAIKSSPNALRTKKDTAAWRGGENRQRRHTTMKKVAENQVTRDPPRG